MKIIANVPAQSGIWPIGLHDATDAGRYKVLWADATTGVDIVSIGKRAVGAGSPDQVVTVGEAVTVGEVWRSNQLPFEAAQGDLFYVHLSVPESKSRTRHVVNLTLSTET